MLYFSHLHTFQVCNLWIATVLPPKQEQIVGTIKEAAVRRGAIAAVRILPEETCSLEQAISNQGDSRCVCNTKAQRV